MVGPLPAAAQDHPCPSVLSPSCPQLIGAQRTTKRAWAPLTSGLVAWIKWCACVCLCMGVCLCEGLLWTWSPSASSFAASVSLASPASLPLRLCVSRGLSPHLSLSVFISGFDIISLSVSPFFSVALPKPQFLCSLVPISAPQPPSLSVLPLCCALALSPASQSLGVSVLWRLSVHPPTSSALSLPFAPRDCLSSRLFHPVSLLFSVSLWSLSSLALQISGCPSWPLRVSCSPSLSPPFFLFLTPTLTSYLRSNCFCLGWTGLVVGGGWGERVALGGFGGTEVAWWS